MGRYCSRVVFLTIGYYRSGVFDQLCYCNVNEITFSIVLIFSIWVSCFAILSVYEDLNMKKIYYFMPVIKNNLTVCMSLIQIQGRLKFVELSHSSFLGLFGPRNWILWSKYLNPFFFHLNFGHLRHQKGEQQTTSAGMKWWHAN